MMSSGRGPISKGDDLTGAYGNVSAAGNPPSKSALDMLTVELATALPAHGCKVNAADPGYTATDFYGGAGHGTPAGQRRSQLNSWLGGSCGLPVTR